MKNILLTNMSTLNPVVEPSKYFGLFLNAHDEFEERYCYGAGQLEAGTKYFLSKVDIHKIIVIGTEATAKETIIKLKKNGAEEVKTTTANNFYKENILEFLKSEEIVEGRISMVPLAENCSLTEKDFQIIEDVASPDENVPQVDNVQGIVNAILKIADSKEEEINLYIDMQGGIRTSGFVRNAVLSIVGNEKDSRVKIQEIIATEFNRENKTHRIVNETKRYKIMDLAAGMNAFVRYGKVDLLKSYCEERDVKPVKYNPDENSRDSKLLGNLLWLMEKVDDSISLCNVKGLDEAIKGMKSLFDKEEGLISFEGESDDDRVFVKSVFDILIDGIKRDYGAVLEDLGDDRHTVELISWCTRKGFLQQALTLVEDQMPRVFLKKEADVLNDQYVLKYKEKDGKELELFGEAIGKTFYDEENNLFYSLDCSMPKGWDGTAHKNVISSVNTNSPKPFNNGGTVANPYQWPDKIVANILKLPNNNIHIEKDNGIQNMSTQLSEVAVKAMADDLAESRETDDVNTFIDKYAAFQIANNEREFNKIHKDAASVYYKIKREGFGFIRKPILTLVNLSTVNNEVRAFVCTKLSQDPNRKLIITMKRGMEPVGQRKRRLDDLFLLHGALKTERNCTNHASEKGVRLPSAVVKRALEIYVEEAKYFVS